MEPTVGIRELRARLSECVAAAESGRELTVTNHGRAVARLVPLADDDRLPRLRERGLLIEPSAPFSALELPEPIDAGSGLSDLVAEQRR